MADNFFGITDTGRVRANNEDAFIAQKVLDGRYIAACVIDGVGGYEGGEIAAALARQAILDYLSVSSGDAITTMREAFVVANEKIAAEKAKNPRLESMACVATLALVDVAAKTFSFAHIGDTRLYLLRDRSLVKISKDQSFVGYLEDSGRISEDEAMQHPKRNEINNAIGFDAQLNAADIETGTSPFLPGDLLLLCSDGLSDLLRSSAIAEILLTEGTLAAKAGWLVAAANEKGGKDNITAVLVRNHKKPVVQKAYKPAVAISKKDEQQATSTAKANSVADKPVQTRQQQGPKWITRALAFLCVVLSATVAVLLYQKLTTATSAFASAVEQKNRVELKIQEAIDTLSTNLFSPVDSLSASPVVLTDTLWIRKDTLHIRGMGFLKSSSYNGPAIALAQTCKYVLLENLTLQNFDVGVLMQNQALHLKNVRFVACRVPVLSQRFFPDGSSVSGTPDSFFLFDSSAN